MICAIRIFALALFVVVIGAWSYGVRLFVASLSDNGVIFGSGVCVGIAICYAFWMWDDRIQRGKSGN